MMEEIMGRLEKQAAESKRHEDKQRKEALYKSQEKTQHKNNDYATSITPAVRSTRLYIGCGCALLVIALGINALNEGYKAKMISVLIAALAIFLIVAGLDDHFSRCIAIVGFFAEKFGRGVNKHGPALIRGKATVNVHPHAVDVSRGAVETSVCRIL